MKISKGKISVYSRLGQKKFRLKEGLFLIEGSKCVLDTLGAFASEALLATPQWLADHPEVTGCFPSGSFYECTQQEMEKVSTLSTAPEVIAVCKLPDARYLPSKLEPALYLMLDGVQDPGNLGTIVRTADWFGIREIFASRDTVDLYNPKTIQATMGALKRVKVHYCDLTEVADKNPALPLYGTLLDGEDIYKAHLSPTGFIVMGNEGNGLSEAMRRRVTHRLLIPSFASGGEGCSESLNVAIATAVTLSEFRRREI